MYTAIDSAAGECETFSGPCDNHLLFYQVRRYNHSFRNQFSKLKGSCRVPGDVADLGHRHARSESPTHNGVKGVYSIIR